MDNEIMAQHFACFLPAPCFSCHCLTVCLSVCICVLSYYTLCRKNTEFSNFEQLRSQKAQLCPRDPRDALYQLKCWPVVRITQTDGVSAGGALTYLLTYFQQLPRYMYIRLLA